MTPSASGLGHGERVPLGRAELERVGQPVYTRHQGRASRGAPVGAGARLPVGRDDIGVCIAAIGGHLQALQWAREHDCPWNNWTAL